MAFEKKLPCEKKLACMKKLYGEKKLSPVKKFSCEKNLSSLRKSFFQGKSYRKRLNLCTIMDVALFLVSVSLVVALVAGERSVSRTAFTHQEEMKVCTL